MLDTTVAEQIPQQQRTLCPRTVPLLAKSKRSTNMGARKGATTGDNNHRFTKQSEFLRRTQK
jgi:hypothetical protein